jgi:putative chitinase
MIYTAKIKITAAQIWQLFPAINTKRGRDNKENNIKGFVYTYNKYANYFGIDTKLECAHFIAQLTHESDSFNAYTEYASGQAYEGRKDLGNVYAGDGAKFKGRGPIQTTGRSNYAQVGNALLQLPFLNESEKQFFTNNAILKNPTLLADPVFGTLAAFIYWAQRDINLLCKPKNERVSIRRLNAKGWYTYQCTAIEAITRKINGGLNGFADREKNFDKLMLLLSK